MKKSFESNRFAVFNNLNFLIYVMPMEKKCVPGFCMDYPICFITYVSLIISNGKYIFILAQYMPSVLFFPV